MHCLCLWKHASVLWELLVLALGLQSFPEASLIKAWRPAILSNCGNVRVKWESSSDDWREVFERGISFSLFLLLLAWNEWLYSTTPSTMMFSFAKGRIATGPTNHGPTNHGPTNQEPLKFWVKINIFSVLVDYLRYLYSTRKLANLRVYQRRRHSRIFPDTKFLWNILY